MRPHHRLFLAFWPEPAQQTALAQATRTVVEQSGGHAVPPENLHITLVFIGSVAESAIAGVESIAGKVAQQVGSTTVPVTLDVLEYWKEPRILCLTAGDPADARAERIVTLLRDYLTGAGFSLDRRPFRPHVTLARKAARGGPVPMQPSLQWHFNDFALVESQTGPQGSVYHCRTRFKLSPLDCA